MPKKAKKPCRVCGKKFTPGYHRRTKTCSSECARENKKQISARASARAWKENRAERLAYIREYRRKKGPGHQRAGYLRFKYGLELADVERVARKQRHKCAICREKKKLCIDHDHDTGAFRGLLCHRCNSAIGLLDESPKVIKAALRYLGAKR